MGGGNARYRVATKNFCQATPVTPTSSVTGTTPRGYKIISAIQFVRDPHPDTNPPLRPASTEIAATSSAAPPAPVPLPWPPAPLRPANH